jgi:hypothetical protein
MSCASLAPPPLPSPVKGEGMEKGESFPEITLGAGQAGPLQGAGSAAVLALESGAPSEMFVASDPSSTRLLTPP